MQYTSSDNSLNEVTLYQTLKEAFPSQNDFYETDYHEELQELNDFGIATVGQLKSFLAKHRLTVLAIDADPLDEFHEQHYKNEYGDALVDERIKGGYWFAFPALLRIAMELEFGDAYRQYSKKRDGV
ncbi:MAG: hypothetical protein EOP49_00365 [Sphingobacteriales bacterium]|nr:MAG: hypothetical protein EOP49_00365 [Sphingobacteriales bacterium]